MAPLRKHPGSRYWFVRFRDPQTACWREQSTHLAHADPQQTRAALRIRDKHSQEEALLSSSMTGAWQEWVPHYIKTHYGRESTSRRATFAWERLSQWLQERNLRHPRQVRYEHAHEYLAWRKGGGTSHNTALYEIKFLSFLLNEAIRREFAERNVVARLGIGREHASEKPELTDEQIQAARKALRQPEWMRIAFEIQLYTGCRFSETSMLIARIDFDDDKLTITDSKRKPTDPRKHYTVPMDACLKSILKQLEGERTVPVLSREMNSRYNEKLKAATGATSHSLRVTFISRCEEAGLSEREAMRLVNHSSKEVHAIYSRRRMDYLRAPRQRVCLPAPV